MRRWNAYCSSGACGKYKISGFEEDKVTCFSGKEKSLLRGGVYSPKKWSRNNNSPEEEGTPGMIRRLDLLLKNGLKAGLLFIH